MPSVREVRRPYRLSAERRAYWKSFLDSLPKRIRPAFLRDITRFEQALDRSARQWRRVLMREFGDKSAPRRRK